VLKPFNVESEYFPAVYFMVHADIHGLLHFKRFDVLSAASETRDTKKPKIFLEQDIEFEP